MCSNKILTYVLFAFCFINLTNDASLFIILKCKYLQDCNKKNNNNTAKFKVTLGRFSISLCCKDCSISL